MIEVIKLANITKRFNNSVGAVQALTDVSLRVARGEYLSIVGASGSGKSTLLHLIGCMLTPSSGSYQLQGRDVSSMSDDDSSRLRLRTFGFVFQKFHLIENMTSFENVALPLTYAKVSKGERDRLTSRALAAVGLTEKASYAPRTLSGGQQQRVAIARAIVNAPSVILADEPTGNLDSKNGAEILELLESFVTPENVVILVTHDPQISARTQRTIHMSDGRIIADIRR